MTYLAAAGLLLFTDARERDTVAALSDREGKLIMNKTELAQALVTGGHVERAEDAEAVLDALASIIWHALEHRARGRVAAGGHVRRRAGDRHRRAVKFQPASELEVAVNRHHVES